MTCTPIDLGGGAVGIVCTRDRRRAAPCSVPGCGRPHVALCDFKLKGGRTCDAKLCQTHRWPVPGLHDRDYCPPHRKAHQAQGSLF